MPRNSTYACFDCRFVSKYLSTCPYCTQPMSDMGIRWTAPKHNDRRAWRRIRRGEIYWNRRKSRRNWRYRNVYDSDNVIKKPNQKKGRGRTYKLLQGLGGGRIDLGG